MGSCVSFPRPPPPAEPAPTAEEFRRQRAVAKVVNPDGSMALLAGPFTAREALAPAADHAGAVRRRPSSSSPPLFFLCSADELGLDAPPRALAGGEALQPGQLYFALPAPMLRRPLSGKDMAALAVRAATALAAEAGLAAAGRSSPRRGEKVGAAGAPRRQRRRQASARVAPVLDAVSNESRPDGAWKDNEDTTVQDGDRIRTRTAVKTRRRAGYRSGSRHHRAAVQRLSAIAEDGE